MDDAPQTLLRIQVNSVTAHKHVQERNVVFLLPGSNSSLHAMVPLASQVNNRACPDTHAEPVIKASRNRADHAQNKKGFPAPARTMHHAKRLVLNPSLD